jgi:Flp pilus assembly protein TadG
MKPARRSDRAQETGTITLWILGLCLMVFLLGGISLDLWRAFSERRSLASAADAAAVAGASAIDEAVYRSANVVQLLPAQAEQRARESLASQLDRRSLRGARVTADLSRVTVVVSGAVDFTLLNLVTPGGAFEVEVRATAQPDPES